MAFISDARTGAVLHKLSGHTSLIQQVAVSPDGRYVATSSRDKTAKVWDAETGSLVQTFTGHSGDPLQDGLLPRQPIAPDREPRQHRAAVGHRERQ